MPSYQTLSAADVSASSNKTYLVLGNTGSGKTTLARTIPGKKFAYIFDPNALESLRGDPDIDYAVFTPDVLRLDITSLSKDKAGNKIGDKLHKNRGSDTYVEWETDFYARDADNFFDAYDAIILDSLTTFGDMAMDRVLTINGRPGEWPNQDDYGPQMTAIASVFRTFTAYGKVFYVTGHFEMKQDEVTKRIFEMPMVTGRLRVKLPLLFSEILRAEGDTDSNTKKGRFSVGTRPTRQVPLVRTTFRHLDAIEDVTIDWNKPLNQQGIGGFLNKERLGVSTGSTPKNTLSNLTPGRVKTG